MLAYKPKELFQEMFGFGLISPLYCVFFFPAPENSGEHTFNVLKQVKNYFGSTIGQDRLNGFATLNIKYDLARQLQFPL